MKHEQEAKTGGLMARFALVSLLLPAVVLIGGCSIAPQAREAVSSYDLGPPVLHPRANPGARAPLLIPLAAAPSLFDNTGMVYRLSYLDAARPQVYSQSRWADSPTALLTQRVRSRYATVQPVVNGNDGASAAHALRIDIEDFSQHFDAADRSRVSVRVRATLVALSSRTLSAQQTFSVEQPAQPHAEGAAKALAQATDTLIERMLEWTTQQLKGG